MFHRVGLYMSNKLVKSLNSNEMSRRRLLGFKDPFPYLSAIRPKVRTH